MIRESILIKKYMPVNYSDCFVESMMGKPYMTTMELFDSIFVRYPRWAQWLLRLRDGIAKQLGLKTGVSFEDMIVEQSSNEIVLGREDRHLAFYVSLFCSDIDNGRQTVSVCTVVRYGNFFGRIYFAAIWLFHWIVVRRLFKRAIRKWGVPT